MSSHQENLIKALIELMDCSRAIVGADRNDERAQEAFDMYFAARTKARAALNAAALKPTDVARIVSQEAAE